MSKNMESKGGSDDAWDDTLLIKAYDDSVKLSREELARRISLFTSKKVDNIDDDKKATAIENAISQAEYKVGDYVRATYEDGIDYEAKIISIDENAETCLLKYIGYDNEQEVALCDLIKSWGKKVRRLQFAKAKLDANEETARYDCAKPKSKTSKPNKMSSIPPPPPIPPMLTASQNPEDSEHLSAMLMSWYMSGYYTGVYQGMQMAKSGSKK